MKTFNKEDVFCVINAKDAMQYIGHECYFEDSYKGLQYSIDNNIKGLLKCVRGDDITVDCIFLADRNIEVMDSRYIMSFGLCLPCEKVYGKEDEYRPFRNEEEFESVVGKLGSEVKFKFNVFGTVKRALFTGSSVQPDNIVFSLGAYTFSPRELFEEYVLIKDGKEVPFGIKMKSNI